MHREESQIDANYRKPKMPFTQGFIVITTRPFRQPIINTQKIWKVTHLALTHNENAPRQNKYLDIDNLLAQSQALRPENPPMVNKITKAIANNMGVSKESDPRHMVATQLKTLMPVGTAINIVTYIK